MVCIAAGTWRIYLLQNVYRDSGIEMTFCSVSTWDPLQGVKRPVREFRFRRIKMCVSGSACTPC